MRVALIAPYPDITALGIRYLSARLNEAGIETRILFIPTPVNRLRFRSEFTYAYSRRELDLVQSFCDNSDLVGISFMSNYLERAVQLTDHLKKTLNIPVMWGGIHPTACPESSLDHADMVCRGEGEEALLELCEALRDGKAIESIPNIWLKRDHTIISNDVRPLAEIDTIPFPDYRLNVHSILDRDRQETVLLDEDSLCRFLKADAISQSRDPSSRRGQSAMYQIMATRGCPHHCSFCYNSEFQRMYPLKKYLRRRSTENIIAELVVMKNISPRFQYVVFCDDSFFAGKESEIGSFAERYKAEIALPFHCLGSPQTITQAKMTHLVEAGMVSISMGIQSGSTRTNELYDRRFREGEVLKATGIINAFKGRIAPPAYDFIIDNPFESREDELQSLDLILRLPRPFHLCLGSLVFFPGSGLYHKALEAGILTDEFEQIYRKEYHEKQGTYLNILFYLAGFALPDRLLRFMMRPYLVKLFDRPLFSPVYVLILRSTRGIRLLTRWLKLRHRGKQ